MKKINIKRDLLEHRFKLLKREEAEDALDIATLFLAYTDKFWKNICLDAEFDNIMLEYDMEKKQITVTNYENKPEKTGTWKNNDPIYQQLVKVLIKIRSAI